MTLPQTGKQKLEPRPRSLTPEMKLSAATKLAHDLVKEGLIKDGEIADCASDIAKHAGMGSDGYELAKDLESYENWFDCNLEMANALDGFSSYAMRELETAEKLWAERNNIQPPYTVGTRIKTNRGDTGIITEIYEHCTASYAVKIDNDPQGDEPTRRRTVVKFEDAEAA